MSGICLYQMNFGFKMISRYKEIKRQSNYPLGLLETPGGRQKTNISLHTALRNTNEATLPFIACFLKGIFTANH